MEHAGAHDLSSSSKVTATTTDLFEKLERDEIDCAITAEPPFSLAKAYTWRLLQNQPMVLILPETLDGSTVEQIIASAKFIRMARASWTGQIVSAFLKHYHLSPNEQFEISAQETIIMLVRRGLGVSLLPDTGIAEAEGLKKIVVGDDRHVRRIGLLSSGHSRTALVSALADALARAARAQDEPDA